MQESKSVQTEKVKDRVLGDEWVDWDGSLKSYEGVINEKRSIFISLALLALILVALSGFLFWYLISPRLREFHPLLPFLSGVFLLSLAIVSMIQFVLTVSGIRAGKHNSLIFWLMPLTFKLGERFGISKDRVANSFIKVSNILSRAFIKRERLDRLLIILPRCLESEVRKRIAQFKESYKTCEIFTAAGGDAARQIIRENKPRAIIAVACERDLISGIQDVARKIPVIAIANKRPEGPCKNTFIDVAELEDAIQFCLNNGKTIPA